jgi:DNA-binding CsgD family transcriptional regulator
MLGGMLPLERESALEAIAELVAGAITGCGGALVLEGPAGVGKSTLLAHAEQTAGAGGVAVVRARGHELERALGWGVARSLLEASVSDAVPAGPAGVVFGATDGAQDAFSILHALYRITVRLAEAGPLLLTVDDAHWADDPSLRYLLYLLRRAADQPIGLLIGTRPGASGMLEQLTGDPGARVQVLEPLRPDAVTVLVRRLTAGNPLQVRELLAAIDGPADEATLAAGAHAAARSLGRSVLRRLGALPAAAQGLARAVAVFEDDAPLRLAAALADLAPTDAAEAAEQLERADLLRAGDPLGFTHPLLRAAVYGQLPFAERALTHGRAARLLAAEGAPDEQVSAHLLASVPTGDAAVVAILRSAARRALAQGVPPSAVAYLERALREPPPPADRAGVLAALGRAEAVAGRPEAVGHLEAAVALAAEPAERAALLLAFGRALHHGGRLDEAGEAFRRGLEEAPTPELESAYLVSAMHIAGRAADVHRRGEGILAELRLGTHAERELAGAAMMMALYAGRPRDEVVAVARRIDAAGRTPGDARTPYYVVGALIWCDEFDAATDALAPTLADAYRRGSARRYAMASQLRSRQLLCTGPIAEAADLARAAVEVWRNGQQMYLHAAAYCLVTALLAQDELDEASAALAVADAQQPASAFFATFRHVAAGRLAVRRGDDEQALAAFLAAGKGLTDLRTTNPAVLPWRSEAGLAAHRLGRTDEGRSLIADELRLAERFGAARPIGNAMRATALLDGGEAAVPPLRRACDVLAASGAHVEHARALVDLGVALRRTGDPLDARPMLRRALSLAEETGAVVLATRARDELRLAGGRARPAIGAPGGLTPSEHRIAALAASGQTNRQIADELFLTVKSVEWHLGNAYRKLDVRGRGELAGRLA